MSKAQTIRVKNKSGSEKVPKILAGITNSIYQVVGVVDGIVWSYKPIFNLLDDGLLYAGIKIHVEDFNVPGEYEVTGNNFRRPMEWGDESRGRIYELFGHYPLDYKEGYASKLFDAYIPMKGPFKKLPDQVISKKNKATGVIPAMVSVLHLDDSHGARVYRNAQDITAHLTHEFKAEYKRAASDGLGTKMTFHDIDPKQDVHKLLGFPTL